MPAADLRGSERLSHLTRRTWSCVLVGVLAGLAACALYWLLQAGQAFFLGVLCHVVPPEAAGEPSPFAAGLADLAASPRRWLLLLMPAFGGLVSGWLVERLAPETAGAGTDAAIWAFHRHAGRIRARVPLVKAITSAITLGSGGSGGREGPIVQIGAGLGSLVARRLDLPDHERRLLLLAGMGAGVAALFKAPLAGALFAGEVLYHDEELEHEALLPATVAAVVAYSIFATVNGWQPLFRTPPLAFARPLDLLGYVILGVVVAAGAWLYVRCFHAAQDRFARGRLPRALRPAVGGLLTGLIGLALPAALGGGYGQIQRCLDRDPGVTLGFCLALALLKILATACSIGSGGSGGVFGPAMVIGGSLGYACGLVCHQVGLVTDPRAMVLVGMAGFFGGAAHVPLSTLIMVSEMTGDYHLLVPCMLTVTVAVVLLRRVRLFRSQVSGRLTSPVHLTEAAAGVLRGLPVAACLNPAETSIAASLPLGEVATLMAAGGHTRYPVVDHDQSVIGVLDVRDVLRAALDDRAATQTAADLASPQYASVGPQRSLEEAVRRIGEDAHGLVVVVDPQRGERYLGVLRRQDVLRALDPEQLAALTAPNS